MSDTYGSESRTEKPTARRIDKAREEGSVSRAHGVSSSIVLVTGAAALSLGGARLVGLLELCLRRGLSFEPERTAMPGELLSVAGRVVLPGLEVIAPFLISMAVVGFVADTIVGGWIFSARPLSPDFSRISPVRGFQRLLSRAAFVEVVKALVKFAVFGTIAFFFIRLLA